MTKEAVEERKKKLVERNEKEGMKIKEYTMEGKENEKKKRKEN